MGWDGREGDIKGREEVGGMGTKHRCIAMAAEIDEEEQRLIKPDKA